LRPCKKQSSPEGLTTSIINGFSSKAYVAAQRACAWPAPILAGLSHMRWQTLPRLRLAYRLPRTSAEKHPPMFAEVGHEGGQMCFGRANPSLAVFCGVNTLQAGWR